MASQVLGDDFTGSTFEESAALLQTGVTAIWRTESDVTFSNGSFARTSLGATLSPTHSVGAIRRAVATITGMVLGTGVNVFEFSGYAQPRLHVFLANTTAFVGIRIRNTGTGSWESNAGNVGSFALGTHAVGTLVTLRIEIEASATRYYVNGTLVATTAGHPVGTSIPIVRVQYTTSTAAGLPEAQTNLLLKYVHVKTETVSGALGVPVLAAPPVPAVLIQDDFRAGALTLLRGSPWVGAATGVWGVTTADLTARRTSGGLIVDVGASVRAIAVGAVITNSLAPIGTGVAVARFVFYGNPAITISFGTGGYLAYYPSGTSATVGTHANLVSVADATTLAARSEVWFHFGPAGTSIWKNGVSIYSDTSTAGQVGAATTIRSVELSWGVAGAFSDGQLLPGATNTRILDWVLVEHGRPGETASVSPPSTAPITGLQKDCVKPSQIYGSYTVGGVRTIIVPRGTRIPVTGTDYPAGEGPKVTGGTTVTHRDGRTSRRTLPKVVVEVDIPSSMQDGLFLPNNCRLVSTQYPATLEYASVAERDQPVLCLKAAHPTMYYTNTSPVTMVGRERLAMADRFFTLSYVHASPNIDMGWGGYGGVMWDVRDTGTILIVPYELTTVPGFIGESVKCEDTPPVFEEYFSENDLGLPESSPTYSAVITLRSANNLQVCGGPADGVGVDRIVVLGTIPPSEITRLNITIYPDYTNRSPKPLPDPNKPPDPLYSLFWTAFDDSYEAP